MLTSKSCAEFCDLNTEDLMTFKECAHMNSEEVCAFIESLSATPQGCRKLLKMMHAHLERVEAESSEERIREAHQAINQFVATHHFI